MANWPGDQVLELVQEILRGQRLIDLTAIVTS